MSGDGSSTSLTRWYVRTLDARLPLTRLCCVQVINAGDGLEFLSGGILKATIHRVVQPPPDQRGYTRLGVIYFAMSDDDVRLMVSVRLLTLTLRSTPRGDRQSSCFMVGPNP